MSALTSMLARRLLVYNLLIIEALQSSRLCGAKTWAAHLTHLLKGLLPCIFLLMTIPFKTGAEGLKQSPHHEARQN